MTQKTKRRMKYLVMALALAMTAAAASAQHYLGVRAGIGSGTGRFFPKEEMGSVWGLYSGGISWKYYSKERFLGGVEVDLMLMQQGYKILDMRLVSADEKPKQFGYYQRKINSVMVPMSWQPHVYLFQRKLRVFLNLAVTFSYNFSSEEKNVNDTNPEENFDRDYTMKLTRDNPFGFGLMGGGGAGWSFGRFELLGEVRYYFGLGDILRNRNKYESNPLRSPLDGLQIQLGIYYRLGKGGILAPMGKKLQRKMDENKPEVIVPTE